MTATPASKLELPANDPHKDLCSLLTQKTELIGALAQAMANQLNNVMMAITGYAELELKKASVKDRRALEQVLSNATRATSLIQKLLDFSRKRTLSPELFDVNGVITDFSVLLRELLGEPTELLLKLDENSPVIYGDRVEVEQILLALVLIARNTMSASGQLTVSTLRVDLKPEFLESEDGAQPGKYVELCVEGRSAAGKDCGVDVDLNPSLRSNLSLAVVRAMVKDCYGFVRCSNEPGGRGSCKLYFPAARPETSEEVVPKLPPRPAVAKTILVVEDDDAVRVPAAEFLMMEGFKVLQARTGSEALHVVEQSRSSLDVLITDIFMPKMNGHEVARKLLEEHPHLKVLYISGDPSRSGSAASSQVSRNTTLRKPFRLNMLRDKIRDLLGE
jgi:two-component system, cell cycle sensor histidine kinase and response regulator CckA